MYKEVPLSSYISFDYHFNAFSGHIKDQIVSEVFFREKKRQRSLYVGGSYIEPLNTYRPIGCLIHWSESILGSLVPVQQVAHNCVQ